MSAKPIMGFEQQTIDSQVIYLISCTTKTFDVFNGVNMQKLMHVSNNALNIKTRITLIFNAVYLKLVFKTSIVRREEYILALLKN